eukprot:TRINITY_DN121798_c0_g1_i1.p1 TRINITY_DN121798_c0_g1~~TRINITY_DN121798_c0_g1_i1.p1  ORF type:complete len:173 (-),score=17.45 TRINITY_DN121798_c0_g1_i1:323-841(-)
MASTFRAMVPEPVRFMTSSGIGSAAFYVLNELMVAYNPYKWQKITVAWFGSYVISIWLQHFLHATLVYGWNASYWRGLFSTYMGYSAALVVSVPINAGLVNYLGLNAGQAWLGTLLLTGIANYFLLGFLLKADTKDEGSNALLSERGKRQSPLIVALKSDEEDEEEQGDLMV